MGLISSIGQFVICSVCRDIKNLQDKGLVDVTTAINVSSNQFHQIDVVLDLAKSVKNFEIDATKIEVELTESSIMNNCVDLS